MKEAKKDRLPLYTMICFGVIFLILVATYVTASYFGSYLSADRTIMVTGIGILIFAICQFFREKEYFRAAPFLYGACVCVLGIQLIAGDPDYLYDMRVITIDYYYNLYTSALLSLTYLFVAWYISRQKQFRFREYMILSVMMGLPAILVMLQDFLSFGVVALIVYTAVLCYLKKENRLKVHGVFIFLPAIIAVILTAVFFATTKYGGNLFQLLITRGQSDILGAGSERLLTDRIFEGCRAFGFTSFEDFYKIISDRDYYWSGSNLTLVFATLGYVPGLVAVGIYTLFFVLIFRMVSRINQSRFAKGLAVTLSLYLLTRAVVAVFSIAFLLDKPFDLPFMERNMTLMMTDFIALSFIVSLYRRRNDKSEIAEIEAGRTEDEHVSVVSVVRDYVNDDEKDIDGYFSDKDKPIERIKRLLLGEEEEFYKDIEEMFVKQEKVTVKKENNKILSDEDETYIREEDLISSDTEEGN